MTVNEKIKELRVEKKMSQEKLAEQMDISRQAVAKWESGTSLPDTQHLLKLSQIFNVPVEEITGTHHSNTFLVDGTEKCSFCGKTAKFYGDKTLAEAYCSPRCQQLQTIALNKIRKNMKWFVLGIVTSIALLLFAAFFNKSLNKKYLAGGGMLILGIILILFPFCTPEAYKKYGYIKTTKIGRMLGLLTETIGITILIWG